MKKSYITLIIIGCITFILITSFLLSDTNNKDYVEYKYMLNLTADENASYNLIISIPEGWENFTESLKEKNGKVNFTITDIDSQPAINVTGIGDISLNFIMKSKEDLHFSFKNWNMNGTTKIFFQSNNASIWVSMTYTLNNNKRNYDSMYDISIGLRDNGWQYVLMRIASS